MSDRFIIVGDMDINLSSIKCTRTNHQTKEITYLDNNGDIIAKERRGQNRCLADIAAPVIPAAPGSFATVLVDLTDDPEKPEISVEYPAIVGWRILLDSAEPVFSDDFATGQYLVLLGDGDGRLRLPDDQIFDSLEEAKAEAVERFALTRLIRKPRPA